MLASYIVALLVSGHRTYRAFGMKTCCPSNDAFLVPRIPTICGTAYGTVGAGILALLLNQLYFSASRRRVSNTCAHALFTRAKQPFGSYACDPKMSE